MNDELQGDSREYKEAARMYNHDLKEYYRQHNYQVMPEEEEENEEIKVIPLREGRNGNPLGYLSALGLKGNEAATVAAQPLRLLNGVDTLSDNKVLSRINLSGNKASSSSYPSVRLAQGYGRNTMSDGSFRLAQNTHNKKDPFLYEKMDAKELEREYPILYVCDDLYNDIEIFDPERHNGGSDAISACLMGLKQTFFGNRYDEKMAKYALERCLEKGRDEKYCNDFSKSMLQCYRLSDILGKIKNEKAYDTCYLGPSINTGIEKNIPATAIEFGGKSLYKATGKKE